MAVQSTVAAALWLLCAPLFAFAQVSEDDIARAIVIGQVYPSGNVYAAGFVEDDTREWPSRIAIVPLDRPTPATRPSADFVRALRGADDEIAQFTAREGDPDVPNIFHTIDRAAVTDHPLAVYFSRDVRGGLSFIGVANSLALIDITQGRPDELRPATPREQQEIAAAKQALPKNVECTTEPQWLDEAKVILTGRIAAAGAIIRLSSYEDPGCLGHLSTIYILDVMVDGRQPRRFEFRHYQGLL